MMLANLLYQKIIIMEGFMTKTNSSLLKNNKQEVYMIKTNSLQKQQNKNKELFMTKKLLSLLLVLSILCSSAFAYSDEPKRITIITFQGPVDVDNVAMSNLFAIELVKSKGIIVKSGKGIDSSLQDRERDRERDEYYSSLYSSSYENSAIEIAKKLRTDYVLLGQINKLGEKTKLIIRVIDTKGNHIAGDQCTFENPEEIQDSISSMCNKIVYGINSSSKKY